MQRYQGMDGGACTKKIRAAIYMGNKKIKDKKETTKRGSSSPVRSFRATRQTQPSLLLSQFLQSHSQRLKKQKTHEWIATAVAHLQLDVELGSELPPASSPLLAACGSRGHRRCLNSAQTCPWAEGHDVGERERESKNHAEVCRRN